jgi:protein-S-isoprenylcysteine O-methyltransferase Ste14
MERIAELSHTLIPALWLIWVVGWMVAALDVKRTRWRESRATAVYNRAPVVLGLLILLFAHWLPEVLTRRLVPSRPELPALGTLLVLLGLLLAVWARWHLGRNWSGIVTLKEDHTLIKSGPYRLVRHPIYSGIALALVGTALAIGAAYGFIAMALILLGFVLRIRLEEARMRDTFPEYADYCRHTARLIPGVY